MSEPIRSEPARGQDPQPGRSGPGATADRAMPGTPQANGAPADRPSVDDLTARVAELEDLRLRALADLDNTRKRGAAQARTAAADAEARVAAQFLPVVDNLERALAHAQADPDAIIEGVRAVRDQADAILARLGFPRREEAGVRFDPARHEAVAVQAGTDADAGTVIEVVRAGYGDREHQLRPAQVVVAKAD